MDRRWVCVIEAKDAIAKAEAVVEREHNLRLAHLRTTLTGVSQAEGAVSQEYLRTHVNQLEQALKKAKEIGLKEEDLLSSAEAELESARSILVHAIVMQSCIDKNPLDGHGAGTCIQHVNKWFVLCVCVSGAMIALCAHSYTDELFLFVH